MTWWHYLVLVNFYLVLFYGFYVLLLQRETFFQLNRVYLVNAAILSFLIPVIHSGWVQNLFITRRVQSTIYNHPAIIYQFKASEVSHLNLGQIFGSLYLAGIVLLSIRLIWQLVQLNKIIHQAKQSVSYSFFNKIKLEDNAANRNIITAHEQVHARQWHSVDVLIIELVMIINWFNPVIYFYRLAIKHIHEFIADKQAIRSGTTRSEYALLLLSKTFDAPAHQLVNSFFNKSLLKRRILMLQKGNSKKMALAKYGLSAPLFILMLILSSATINNSKTIKVINKKAEHVFSTTATEALLDIAHAQIPDEQTKSAADNEISAQQKQPIAAQPATEQPAPEQKTTENSATTAIEQMPEFPDGLGAFFQFIGKNIKYPAEMRENNIQGRAVMTFVIEPDGSVSNIRSSRDPGFGAREEAERVIALSPKWTPAIQNGQAIRVQYSVTINFTLAADNDDPKLKLTDTTKSAEPARNNLIRSARLNGMQYAARVKTVPMISVTN